MAYVEIPSGIQEGGTINVETDSPVGDAFGRIRTSNPLTLFDTKQTHDDQPLVWDKLLESGAGITASHNPDEAATTLTSTLNTAGKYTRQTFMRFNYQSGKSHLVMLTGVLNMSGGGEGVQCGLGYYDDNNGLFFEYNAGTVRVVRRTSVSGSPVDHAVNQADWNIDKLDGSGPSRIVADWSKMQLFVIDFVWLGTARTRFSLNLNGVMCVVHEMKHANVLNTVYMSTPNLPIRYQMITTAGSPASSMVCVCSSVTSEGGQSETGVLRYKSTEGAHVGASLADEIYALVGIRLVSGSDAVIRQVTASVLAESNDNFEWCIVVNPAVAGTFTYTQLPDSQVETATGATENTVSGGQIITGGFAASKAEMMAAVPNAIHLGQSIAGVCDTLVLSVRPLSSNAVVQGALTWRELS